MIAAIAPMPAATASCIASARKRTSGTASRKASAPAATSAVYSPRLCPAMNDGAAPPATCHARQTAIPAVSITGCVLRVRLSPSAGPSCTSCHRSSPSASDASANVARTTASSSKPSIMPTCCEPCPGNTKAIVIANLHAYEYGAPREAAADAKQHQVLAPADAAVANGDVEREWNRRGRCVRVRVDGRDHALVREPELARGRVHDAHVRLMRDEPVDVAPRHPIGGERFVGHLGQH